MTLSELIDIECQLLIDNEADPSELRRRDRKIGQEFEIQRPNRHELFINWLKRVHTNGHNSPGKLFESGYRWLGRFLLIFGLITGSGTAASVLSYDGSKPVNVVNFLAIMIGMQLVTIIFFVLNSLPSSVKRLIPGSGEFYNYVRELSYLFSKLIGKIIDHLPARQLNEIWTELQRLKVRQKLYGSIEKWLVVSLTQRFGLAFNIGALATCLYLISFSDLAFAWNTTLNISNQTFHKTVCFIALPWSSMIPDGSPSLDLVESSRYFRLDDEYINTPAETAMPKAIVVGAWWLFLILCLICYGLLPRIFIFIFAKLKLRIALNKIPLNSADFESLYDRLTRPLLETRALDQEQTFPINNYTPDFKSDFKPEGKRCTVIKWGDLDIEYGDLLQHIKDRFGWDIKNTLVAGSLNYEESNVSTCEFLKGQKEKDPLLVLVESWEAPDAAIIYFFKQLRNAISIDRHIIVGLVNINSVRDWKPPSKLDWRTWKEKMTTLADPFLRVESMVEAA